MVYQTMTAELYCSLRKFMNLSWDFSFCKKAGRMALGSE